MSYERMPRVAFFTYGEWAFGTIHKALCKEFYVNGIQADLIEWNRTYRMDEFAALLETYDVFVTCPGNAVPILLNYGVPYEKMVLIAHGRWDIQYGNEFNIEYDRLKGYGGIAKDLVQVSKDNGIERDLKVLQNGVSFDMFYSEPSTNLRRIGYAGKLSRSNPYENIKEWKRGHLVQQISDNVQLPIILKEEMTHLAMPSYYKNVDCLMLSSTENESCGLPLLEAAAAGRVPLSTLVGINKDVAHPTGYILPMDEETYVKMGTEIVNQLKADPKLHQLKCKEAQDYAREYYDWSRVIEPWINLIVG